VIDQFRFQDCPAAKSQAIIARKKKQNLSQEEVVSCAANRFRPQTGIIGGEEWRGCQGNALG